MRSGRGRLAMLTTCRWTMMTAAAVSATSMLPVMQLAGSEITYPEPACYANVRLSNHYRRVFGTITAECPESIHSAPFGNWGVTSNYGYRRDSNQFAGWKRDGSTRHWNSCTTWFRPDGTTRYYNDPSVNPTRQKAHPDVAHVYAATRWAMGDPAWTCRQAAGGVITLRGLFMQLYELDPGCCDREVATLEYPDVNVPMRCRNAWSCSGTSGWHAPNSGARDVSAKIRVAISAG